MAPSSVPEPDTAHDVVLAVRPYDHPDARDLVSCLHDEQRRRYGFADPPEANPNEFQEPAGLFLVGYDAAGRPVACGGYRALQPDTIEIKKMYVHPGHRSHGLGRRVLVVLEESARRAGARRVVLETGVHSPEALRLYASAGYRPIPSYVPGRDDHVNRAFAKDL